MLIKKLIKHLENKKKKMSYLSTSQFYAPQAHRFVPEPKQETITQIIFTL